MSYVSRAQSREHKWERRTRAFCALAIFTIVAATGCTVKSPKVPKIDFTVSISVADDTTTIQELAQDRSEGASRFLKIDADGQMALDFQTAFNERVDVGDRLRVKPQANSFNTQLGEISIPGQEIPDISITMSDLLGGEIPETDFAVPIDGMGFETEVELPLENVTSLSIEEGGLDVSLTNGLPMPVTMRLLLIDLGNGGAAVSEIDLGAIAPDGGVATGSFDLDGKTISGSLAFSVVGGTQDAEVQIQGDPSLDISAILREMTVSEATALIPQQVFTDNQVLEFPDDRIQVTRAMISEGAITLEVRNEIPIIMSVALTLDDLRDREGNAQTFVIDQLSPDEVKLVRFDLTENEFAPLDPLSMRLSYQATTYPTDTQVTIKSGGEIEVSALTENLVFSRVEGILNRLELPFEPVSRTVDFPAGLNNVALGSTSLSVFATSAVGFRSEMSLLITGTNQLGQSGELVVDEVFERGNPSAPVSIVIDPDPEELTAFLNLLPNSITVDPDVLVGDGVGTETIEPDHWVRLDSVVFGAPARFRITDDTQIQPEPIRREFSDDEARRRIQSNLQEAGVTTTIENHIPLGVSVSIQVARTAEDVYTSPILTIPTDGSGFSVNAAPVDGEGKVIGSEKKETTVKLSAEDVLVFLEEGGVYTGVLIKIDGTDGDVELFGTDFIAVQAGAQIVVELNEDLVERQ